jgi:flagellar basal-body rod modification protein FlgD
MVQITSAASGTGSSSTGVKGNDLRDVDLNQFLSMLITEMQNQDPLNPMDNSQFLQQISQIRQIGSTNQLTETLSSLAAGQGLSMASGLIGRQVTALDDNAKEVTGVVEKVSVITDGKDQNNRIVKVHIGSSTVDISNVREIVQASS